jgi:hypothetical protein
MKHIWPVVGDMACWIGCRDEGGRSARSCDPVVRPTTALAPAAETALHRLAPRPRLDCKKNESDE